MFVPISIRKKDPIALLQLNNNKEIESIYVIGGVEDFVLLPADVKLIYSIPGEQLKDFDIQEKRSFDEATASTTFFLLKHNLINRNEFDILSKIHEKQRAFKVSEILT